MRKYLLFIFLVNISLAQYSQKDSLNLGDYYADDQIYLSLSYSQFFSQPSTLSRSNFSYNLSLGFLKDFILNKKGSLAVAVGVGYSFDNMRHSLKVEEVNNVTQFNLLGTATNNDFVANNLEFPFEFRWRTSTANNYSFWRIYTGIKLTYNLSNSFSFDDNGQSFSYTNVSAYNNLQYGLTLSAGYGAFNAYMYYGLTPIFKDGFLNGEAIQSKIMKFGIIFYLL